MDGLGLSAVLSGILRGESVLDKADGAWQVRGVEQGTWDLGQDREG